MLTKRILKLTNTDAIIKFDGTPGSSTIDLDVDLLLPSETLIPGQLPVVNIVTMHAFGKPGSFVSVARNGVNLYDMQSGSAHLTDFLSIGGVTDGTFATSDINVTIAGAEGQLVIRLRKISGYRTRIRPEEFGLDTLAPN